VKRVLIISPHFPPVNAPDCQRVRMSLPYYRQFGWEPEVLAVHPRHRADWHDQSLLASLPADVPVHYCEAVPRQITRHFGIQNLGLRCMASMNRAAIHLLESRRFDLIFFSTTQYMVTPLSRLWKRRFGVPYVIDIQDPWRSDYYERPGAPRPPGGWKYQFARLTAWLFEEQTFRNAAGLISVSHHYFRDLDRRYHPPLAGPSADFAVLEAGAAPPRRLPADGRQHWVAAGSLGAPFSHALRVLCAGLRRLRHADPALAERLHLHFVGTSYAPADQAVCTARPIAEAYGVGDLVTEVPHRIGYLDSLALMREADGLLLLGSDDLAYSPSKITPYHMARRPIIALAQHDSVLLRQVRHLGRASVVTLLAPGAETAPPARIAELLAAAARARAPDFRPEENAEELTAEHDARRQCGIFDQAHRSVQP
jgi:hypothetical protein